jgi:hypothetical protein
MKMLEENKRKILQSQNAGEDYYPLLIEHQRLEKIKVLISKEHLGIDILY